jgi:hypothetical protein
MLDITISIFKLAYKFLNQCNVSDDIESVFFRREGLVRKLMQTLKLLNECKTLFRDFCNYEKIPGNEDDGISSHNYMHLADKISFINY